MKTLAQKKLMSYDEYIQEICRLDTVFYGLDSFEDIDKKNEYMNKEWELYQIMIKKYGVEDATEMRTIANNKAQKHYEKNSIECK